MRIHLVRLLAITLIGGFVAVGDTGQEPATASQYELADLNTYLMDFENASAPSYARDYLSHNGVTYFTALSLQYGRAVWAMDESTLEMSVMHDPFEDFVTGNISRLSAHGDYLFYWTSKSTGYDGNYPTIVRLSTGEVLDLQIPGLSAPFSQTSSFAEHDDRVYFFADSGSTPHLVSFNTLDGSVSDLGATGFDYRTNRGGDFPNDVRSGILSLFEHDGHLYTVKDNPHPTHDDLAIYDIASGTWNTNISNDSWVILLGEFSFAGSDEALLLVPSSVTQYSGSNYKLFSISTSGTMTAIGSEDSRYSSSFRPLQFGSRLLAIHDSTLVEVNTSTGNFDDLTSVVAGAGSTFSLTQMQLSEGQLFLTGSLDSADEALYLWSGSNLEQMVQLPSVQSRSDRNGNGISLFPSLGNSSSNRESGANPTGMIRSLYRDSAVGFEPYHIGFDGTVTLPKQFNFGSEGSSPDLDCALEKDGQLFTRVEVLSREPGSALDNDAMAIVTPTSSNLEYKVFIPSVEIAGTSFEISSMCGFATDGSSVYFSGYANSDDRLFKRAEDGTITHLADLEGDSERTVYHDGQLYMALDDYRDENLWVYDIDSDQLTQLTGDPGAPAIEDDSLEWDTMVSIGDKLFFIAEDDASGDEFVYMQDMDEVFNPTKINQSLGLDSNLSPQDLMVHEGALYFEDDPDNDNFRSIYRYEPETGQLGSVFDPSFENSTEVFYDYFESSDVGLFALTYATVSGSQLKKLIRVSESGEDEEIALPSGFDLEVAAAVPGGLLVSSDVGQAYSYDGTEFVELDINFASRPYELEDAVVSSHGTFFSYSEYPYDSGGSWETELGYMGALQPVAVERFGEAVDESPAQPYTTDPEVLEGQANGSIPPQIITPAGSVSSPPPYSAPISHSGPVVTNIGEPGTVSPYAASAGQTVRIEGVRLSTVTKVYIDGVEAIMTPGSGDYFTMTIPNGLASGIYDLVIESSQGNLTYQDAFVIGDGALSPSDASALCEGVEPSWWTKRISETQAKVYIKCPEVGQKYEAVQQTGGSGSYVSVLAKTITDELDDSQVFSSIGRYIVRTVELEDINRIRIMVDGVESWKVRYNR